MGIDLNCAQILIAAKRSGVSFTRMATLGRQAVHQDRPILARLLKRAGIVPTPTQERELLDRENLYADVFFRLLGAEEITAIDASPYEGARVIHDMNLPIPAELKASFDVVLDSGTLEHVFNFPVSATNAMQMVKLGGRFISCTPSNNWCGHGFYQFSPELFYRLLSTENGYEVESCTMWEEIQGSRFYSVPDPMGQRIELTSRSAAYLLVVAIRTGEPKYGFIPQQSDYVRHWNEGAQEFSANGHGLRAMLRGIPALRNFVLSARGLKTRAPFRGFMTEAEHCRKRQMKRSTKLEPMDGLRVRL